MIVIVQQPDGTEVFRWDQHNSASSATYGPALMEEIASVLKQAHSEAAAIGKVEGAQITP